MLAKDHPKSSGFVLKLVLKVSNAITSDMARGDRMLVPSRPEEQPADRRAGEQLCLVIKSSGSEGEKKKEVYNFPGLEKSRGSFPVPWC